MAETYYDSDLSGEELDAALRKAKSIDQYVLQAQSAASTAESHAQSAGLAESSATSSAKAAESAKEAAASSEQKAQQYAEQVQSQISAAQESASAAQQSASAAAESAASIGDAVEQSAANAEKADTSAKAAAADATRAEEAAKRAEDIADFNPSDYATAEQGKKADTALQPGALDAYALKSEVPTRPDDIGAATDVQGAKADTAVQPGDLTEYARTSDIPKQLPNPQSLSIQLGRYGQTTTYDGSSAESVTITPESIGAQPVGSDSGMSLKLLWTNSSPKALNPGEQISVSGMSSYDFVGIVFICDVSKSNEYDSMKIYPNVSGQVHVTTSTVYFTNQYIQDMQARIISLNPSTNKITMGQGRVFSFNEASNSNDVCIPYKVYGIKI